MPMDAKEIERLIKDRFPGAEVAIKDLAGDGDHYAAHVVMHDVLVLALTIFFIKSQGVYDAASLSGVYFFTAAVALMMLSYAWLRAGAEPVDRTPAETKAPEAKPAEIKPTTLPGRVHLAPPAVARVARSNVPSTRATSG